MRQARELQTATKNQKSALLLALLLFAPLAQAEVTVSNVSAAQRPGTKLMDITYDVSSTATNAVTVSLAVSNGTEAVSATTRTGDVGPGVPTGTGKAIVWDMAADWNGNVATLTYTVVADEGQGGGQPPAGMVLVPGGTNSGTDPDFGAYSLTVEAFYMDKYEVTKALWDEVKNWNGGNGYSYGDGLGKATNHPVHDVTWYDVLKWCNARSQKEGRTPVYYTDTAMTQVYKTGQEEEPSGLGWEPYVKTSANGYRLPTDVQWEYAARGGQSGKRFPWGDTITHSQANYYSSDENDYDISPTREFHPTNNVLSEVPRA